MKPNHLEDLKLENIGNITYNPSYDKLIEDTVKKGEVTQTNLGATAVDTGIFTGRSPKDKYFGLLPVKIPVSTAVAPK